MGVGGTCDRLDDSADKKDMSSLPCMLLRRVTYVVPSWTTDLQPPKHGRILLGHLPTPIMPWACPALNDLGVEWYIKRDDMTGMEASGNKVRKLEFLLAEALAQGADCVVTPGGLQSNHCRATAAAARLLGLEAHLVLLVPDASVGQDPGLEGNLLDDRLLGAKLHLCAAKDYMKYGGDLAAMDKLNAVVVDQLKAQGRKPYVIPVGGTTPMSAWAYINALQELRVQIGMEDDALQTECPFDHIVFAAGSGGTATGLALGCHLSRLGAELHAVNIQHTPEAYFRSIAAEASALGCSADRHGTPKDWLQIHNGAGLGYGHATPENLEFIRGVASSSGVLLDHAYTGKALYYFCEHARMHPERFRRKRVLFWHTGGLLGLYAKAAQLQALLPADSLAHVNAP